MKKFKFLLATLLALTLVACNSTGNTNTEDKTPDQNETVQGETNNDNKVGNETSNKVITYATNANFPPYEYYEGDKIVGIDVDLVNAIAEKTGTTVKIQDMAFTNIIASVNSGKVDAGFGGITKTPEREESVKFSDTYASAIQNIIVNKDSTIKSPADLEGKKIGTQIGTTGDMKSQEDFGIENVQSFDNAADAVLALKNNKVDAVVIDEDPANKFVESNDSLRLVETEYFVEEYGLIFKKDDQELYDTVNNALKELIEDGTVEEIINKYKSAK